MTSSVKKQTIFSQTQIFKFLFLQVCVVFLFICLWFAVYPLIHVFVYGESINVSENSFWYYWPVTLLLFVLLLLLLVCCLFYYKRNGDVTEYCEEKESILNNKRTEFYTISLNSLETETLNENKNQCIELSEVTPSKTERFPRCSVKRKPENLQIEKVEIHEPSETIKYPTASLSPRELFFQDLLQEDNKSNSSVVFNPDNQPLEEAVLSALNKINCDTKKNETKEYFIANVSPTQQNYECCLLPNQVQVQQMQQANNRVVLASPQLAQQLLPLQLEFYNEPEYLAISSESPSGQMVDSIRHLYLGKNPRVIKQCVRCGGAAGTIPVTRTAAIRAWDQRWMRSCQCGGLWRIQTCSS